MARAIWSRRGFLQGVGGAAAAVAACRVCPGRARAALERGGANEKIVVGIAGIGVRGRAHFARLRKRDDVVIAAVCDPDKQYQAEARAEAEKYGLVIDTYVDYRHMLEGHPEIDAVFVATPDHWHALITIECLRAGKDVFCEKPLGLTVAEGRAMVEAARRYGRVVQVGTMQRSDQPQFRQACELVRNGRIGAVDRVVCFYGANPRHDFVASEAAPLHLDWDFYLGPAPERAYNPLIHPRMFRFFRDFSGGILTDWGVHLLDIAQWGLGKDDTSPKRIEAETEMYADNLYEFPRLQHVEYDYGDARVAWWSDDGPKDFEQGQEYGTKFYGTEGEICVNREGLWARGKDGGLLDLELGEGALRLYASTNHHDDFFDAMRRRTRPICDVEIGHRATALSHLGNIASWLGRPLAYDPVGEVFPGDPAATALLRKPMRAPWRV